MMAARRGVPVCALLLAALLSMPAAVARSIIGIDVGPARAVVQLDGAADYRWFRLTDPDRLVIDLQDTVLEGRGLEVPVGVGPVLRVRSAAHGRAHRVVFDLRGPIEAGVRHAWSTDGAAVTVEFAAPREGDRWPTARLAPRQRTSACPGAPADDQILIVLDPGHGGRDGGAVGPGGELEKDVALGIARQLHRLIAGSPWMTSLLTRSGDKYLTLEARTGMAEACDADLLLSIHADSLPGSGLRGASVYVDHRAHERAVSDVADAAARFTPVGLAWRSVIAPQRSTEAVRDLVSVGAARLMLGELHSLGPPARASILGERFAVLRAAVPAVLVETGFISHRLEARALTDPAYQRRIAQALHRALVRHVRRLHGPEMLERIHIVGQRTTVEELASRLGLDVVAVRRSTHAEVLSCGDVLRIGGVLDRS